MYQIQHISQIQFRNASSKTTHFEQRVSAVCGQNGAGKTNLLDAIYYLCFTKSYFSKPDYLSVEKGKMGFSLSGVFHRITESSSVSLILRENNKKELWVDGDQVSPFSAHIGKFPTVFIAPDDVELVTGSSEERRKSIDTVLSQLDKAYLTQLIRYTKTLQDRNKYLKNIGSTYQADDILLDSFDEQLVIAGTYIYQKRAAFLTTFIPACLELFAYISDGLEHPSISYTSAVVVADYREMLRAARQKDLFAQRTTMGIHRDDLELTLQDLPFRQIASQGQKKSMLFALKLAEFSMLNHHFGYEPILLLDDIFEKLDQQRLVKLLDWVCVKNKGQVILTDTHPERVQNALNDISVPFQLIYV